MTDTSRLPEILATLQAGRGLLSVNGAPRPLTSQDIDQQRDTVFREVALISAERGQSVRFTVVEGETRWQLIGHPDGTRTTESSEPAGPRPLPTPPPAGPAGPAGPEVRSAAPERRRLRL